MHYTEVHTHFHTHGHTWQVFGFQGASQPEGTLTPRAMNSHLNLHPNILHKGRSSQGKRSSGWYRFVNYPNARHRKQPSGRYHSSCSGAVHNFAIRALLAARGCSSGALRSWHC